MKDCVFCKIVNKEISPEMVYEDDHVVAFMDLRPVTKGHLLVVPKKHSESLVEADEESLFALISQTQKLAKAVLKATGASGFNLHVNTGEAAGQVVFHTHFHIIPRFKNDGLKLWPHSESEPKTRAQQAAEIKKFLQ